jgi:hypothetical protein
MRGVFDQSSQHRRDAEMVNIMERGIHINSRVGVTICHCGTTITSLMEPMCPAGAAMQYGYTNEQVLAEIEGILEIAGADQMVSEGKFVSLRETV